MATSTPVVLLPTPASVRTVEEARIILNHAKLKESELLSEIQAVVFSSNFSDQRVVLLELDDGLLDHVLQGNNLMFRGDNSDHAVLCTNDTTFIVKEAETSNSLLLFESLSEPKDVNCEMESRIVSREIIGVFHEYLELTCCKPKLSKLRLLLNQNLYRGQLYECENTGEKFTLSKLLDVVQASESEVRLGLLQIEAFNIDGFWRLLEFDYRWRVLTHILNLVEENSWHHSRIPEQRVLSILEELEPRQILEQCLEYYATSCKIQDDEGNDIYRLNEDKICQFFAEVMLHQTGRFNLQEFLEAWKLSIPCEMTVNMRQLEGLALIDRDSFPQTISYFPVWKLPEDINERFNSLFKVRMKWNFDDICPFIRDLATEQLDVNGLLTKHARVSNHNGVRYYTSKRPLRFHWNDNDYMLALQLNFTGYDLKLDQLLNDFNDSLYLHKEVKHIILICAYIILFLLSTTSNILVMITIYCYRRLRSITNYLLVNLSFADLMVTLVCMPMAIGTNVYLPWVYGDVMCKMAAYLQGVAVSASIFTLTAMSIDRYVAIRHPMTFRKVFGRALALKIIAAVWFVSVCLFIPVLFVRRIEGFYVYNHPEAAFVFCIERWSRDNDRHLYSGLLFMIVYAIPGHVLVLTYSMMGCTLCTKKGNVQMSTRGNSATLKMIRGRRKIARVLLILALVFAVCWLPYNILWLMLDVQGEREVHQKLVATLPFALLLGHANSAINPILYCFLAKTFRRCVRDALCRRHQKSHHQEAVRRKLKPEKMCHLHSFVSKKLTGVVSNESSGCSSCAGTCQLSQIQSTDNDYYSSSDSSSTSRCCLALQHPNRLFAMPMKTITETNTRGHSL